jgi:hypothetical protein
MRIHPRQQTDNVCKLTRTPSSADKFSLLAAKPDKQADSVRLLATTSRIVNGHSPFTAARPNIKQTRSIHGRRGLERVTVTVPVNAAPSRSSTRICPFVCRRVPQNRWTHPLLATMSRKANGPCPSACGTPRYASGRVQLHSEQQCL